MSVFSKVPYYSIGQALSGGVDSYQRAKDAELKRKMLEREFNADELYRRAALEGQMLSKLKDIESKQQNLEFQKEYRDKALGLQREKLGLEREKLEREGMGKKLAASLTPAQKKVDESFARDYNDWKLQGGYSTIKRNLGDLRGAISELRENKGVLGKSGPLAGLFAGTAIQDVVNPEASAIQDRINRVVMGSLKATLGAQFTQEEGRRVLEATFNPRQSPEENARRLESLIGELEKQAEAKEKAAEYFEEFGTMRGYKGPYFEEFGFDSVNLKSSQRERSPKSSSIRKHPQAIEALNWAKRNKNDPRAKKILEALGEK